MQIKGFVLPVLNTSVYNLSDISFTFESVNTKVSSKAQEVI